MKFYKLTYAIKEYPEDAYSPKKTVTIGAKDEDTAISYLCFQMYPEHYIDLSKSELVRDPQCVVVSEVYGYA